MYVETSLVVGCDMIDSTSILLHELLFTMHCTFRLSTNIMDKIGEPILSFTMQIIVQVMVEYMSYRLNCEIRTVQGNTWLMEMLHKCSSLRCRGLLCMQRTYSYSSMTRGKKLLA